MKRINWNKVGTRVAIVFGLLAVDAIIAAIASPAIFAFHRWLTLPGVSVTRALGGYNPFVVNPITWTEMAVNAAIYCFFTAGLAVAAQTKKPWRNSFRFLYGAAVIAIIAAWLTPHHLIKVWGNPEEGVVLSGDGSLLIGINEVLKGQKDRTGEFTSTVDDRFPGIQYYLSVGPHLKTSLFDIAAFFGEKPGSRDLVREHRWVIRLWVFLIPLALYPAVALWRWDTHRRRIVACKMCSYNLTRYYGATCPSCHNPNPHARQ